ncbi:DUF1295 domain-containing protein [Candidatus Pacearchaeota archaeon]|nr:DUF1295 domain-containing protein [Candidatus Pacearchaeota archaeon]
MDNLIVFIIALIILIIFSLVDVISHRKFKKTSNLVFHIFGISAVLISLGFLVFSEFKFTFLAYFGILIIIFGIILILLTYIQIKKHFLRARGIVKNGLYKYSRHPMYLGIIIFFIGLIFLVPSFYIFIYSLVAIIFMIWQAYEEEKFLEKKFLKYKNYKKETGMIIPKI